MDQTHPSISEDELKRDVATILNDLKETPNPLVVTQDGRATVVMMSIEAFENAQRRQELLHLLAKGTRDIEANEGVDLDEVLAAADAILKQDP